MAFYQMVVPQVRVKHGAKLPLFVKVFGLQVHYFSFEFRLCENPGLNSGDLK